MRTQFIHFGTNADLPASVRAKVPDDTAQSLFRDALNQHLQDKHEMHAYLKAWRALADAGYHEQDGKWVAKDMPTQADVHVDTAMGNGSKPKDEDKLWVPPVEVIAAAKAAIDSEAEVSGIAPEIMRRMACDSGVLTADVKKVAMYFAKTDPASAWGMPHAMKWAGRVMRKLHAAGVESSTPASQPQQSDRDWQSNDIEISGQIVKTDQAQHLVFGWASIVTIAGKPVTDTQGDQIAEATLEDSAYDFVLHARVGGQMHQDGSNGDVKQIGSLVESMVFTPQKVAAMTDSLAAQKIAAVVDLPLVGWWVGFHVTDKTVWQRIVSGELKAFSVGGSGKREKLAAQKADGETAVANALKRVERALARHESQ